MARLLPVRPRRSAARFARIAAAGAAPHNAAMPAPCSAADAWPYPFWIAHRGGGKLAPENTAAAFGLGHWLGWRMAECDVRLSADGLPFLLHDDRLERTTSGQGPAAAQPWAALARLDAGAWHSPAFAGEPLMTLAQLAAWSAGTGVSLNLEIKPCPGRDAETGRIVAQAAQRLWAGRHPPLLSSFSAEALAAAAFAAPALPRALLIDRCWPGWLDAATGPLGCVAVVAHAPLIDAGLAAQVHAAGLRLLAYTVNDADEARRLLDLGLDGLISDEVARFDPASRAVQLR
jgi:glycerophosphoryl diester phosphodiesterase